MQKVKLLKDMNRYNVSGFDKHTLTGKKGEVVEVSHFNMKILVMNGFAMEYSEEPEDDSGKVSENTNAGVEAGSNNPGTGAEGSGNSNPEEFELTHETILHIQKLTKDKIEEILRDYGVEVDRRKNLKTIQDEMILVVGASFPVTGDNNVHALVRYYADRFMIQLDAKSYTEQNSSKLAEDVGKILTEALSE